MGLLVWHWIKALIFIIFMFIWADALSWLFVLSEKHLNIVKKKNKLLLSFFFKISCELCMMKPNRVISSLHFLRTCSRSFLSSVYNAAPQLPFDPGRPQSYLKSHCSFQLWFHSPWEVVITALGYPNDQYELSSQRSEPRKWWSIQGCWITATTLDLDTQI